MLHRQQMCHTMNWFVHQYGPSIGGRVPPMGWSVQRYIFVIWFMNFENIFVFHTYRYWLRYKAINYVLFNQLLNVLIGRHAFINIKVFKENLNSLFAYIYN